MVDIAKIRDRPGISSLAGARQSRLHLLDFDRDAVAIDQHHGAGDGEVWRGS